MGTDRAEAMTRRMFQDGDGALVPKLYLRALDFVLPRRAPPCFAATCFRLPHLRWRLHDPAAVCWEQVRLLQQLDRDVDRGVAG